MTTHESPTPVDGIDKVEALAVAVRRLVRPGMALHLAYNGGRPNAAVNEIVRQFAGSRPGFRVSAQGFVNSQHALVSEGLVERLDVAFAGENYPAPRPNPVLQRAVRDGHVTVGSWSLWTLTARLMAGALGVPFFPVRSLVGSSMAEEHARTADFAVLRGDNALGSSPVVSALRPDLVLLQGLAADRLGNVLIAPPYGEGVWGALAAREGVLACVERVVDSDVIRAHNTLPVIPARTVRAVCVTPFGSHPYGLPAETVAGGAGYAEDGAYMAELRQAARDPEQMTKWVHRWITGVSDHDDFLEALGAQRLSMLRAALAPSRRAMPHTTPATLEERMTLVAARVIRDRVRRCDHRTILSGIGFAHLAAWTVLPSLTAAGCEVELAAELGMSGFVPKSGDPYLFATQNLPTCTRLGGVLDVLGADVAGPSGSTLGVLGAGQVDRHGNLNSTWTSDGDYLIGSGGANDVASAADDVVVVVKHGRTRLVNEVPYVTAPGNRVSTIVTSRAVLERRDARFVLTRWIGAPGEGPDEILANIRASTGWKLEVAQDAQPEPEPDDADLARLRSFDPRSVFLGR